MRTRTLGITLATLLAGAGLAHADLDDFDTDEDPFDAPAEVDETAPAATTDGATIGATAIDTGEPAWPQEIIMRPLTLPKGSWAAGTDLAAHKSFDIVGDALVVGYGITDELEVGVSYGFALRDFEAKGDVALDAGYAVFRGDEIELIARASFGYSLLGEDLLPIGLGVQGQYTHDSGKFAVVMPADHLSIGIAGDMAPIDFQLPIGVGFQATPNIYAEVTTVLFNLGLSNSANAFFGADVVPVEAGVFFSPNNTMDIGVGVSTDVKNDPGDNLFLFAGFRYYGGV
jgi:hypothetical protein